MAMVITTSILRTMVRGLSTLRTSPSPAPSDDSIEWDGGNLDIRDSFFIDNDYDIYGGPDGGTWW